MQTQGDSGDGSSDWLPVCLLDWVPSSWFWAQPSSQQCRHLRSEPASRFSVCVYVSSSLPLTSIKIKNNKKLWTSKLFTFNPTKITTENWRIVLGRIVDQNFSDYIMIQVSACSWLMFDSCPMFLCPGRILCAHHHHQLKTHTAHTWLMQCFWMNLGRLASRAGAPLWSANLPRSWVSLLSPTASSPRLWGHVVEHGKDRRFRSRLTSLGGSPSLCCTWLPPGCFGTHKVLQPWGPFQTWVPLGMTH